MFLTFDQIKEFTSGAIAVVQEKDRIRFERMTEAQIEAFRTAGAHLYNNAISTTGIRIDFETNSNSLLIHTASAGKFDVMVDNLPRAQYICKGPDLCCLDLEPGDKRITIFLPSHSVGSIAKIRLDYGSKVWAHKYDRKILFIGDSITQGWNSKWDCLSYTYQLTTALNADAINWAVGGSFFTPDAFEDVGFDADFIMIAYGTNDFNVFSSMEKFREKCTAYLERVKAAYPDKPVFCLTPLWRGEENMIRRVGTLQDIRDAITEIAQGFGFTVINGKKLVPHVPYFYADQRLHPDDLGFSLYASNLLLELNKYL